MSIDTIPAIVGTSTTAALASGYFYKLHYSVDKPPYKAGLYRILKATCETRRHVKYDGVNKITNKIQICLNATGGISSYDVPQKYVNGKLHLKVDDMISHIKKQIYKQHIGTAAIIIVGLALTAYASVPDVRNWVNGLFSSKE